MSEEGAVRVVGDRGPLSIGLLAGIYIGMFALFHFLGNTTDVRFFGRSLFGWMIKRWQDTTLSVADYSHGWLIPLISLLAVWRVRRAILGARKRANWWGVLLVCGGLLLHWVGARTQQPRISMVSMILLLWSVPFFLYGWATARHLVFPCAYLGFCVPLTFLDGLTFRLRMLATVVSAGLLNGLGIAAERTGTAIRSTAGNGFNFDVADPCSGLRSLLAITALVAAYAWVSQRGWLRQWALFLASVPLAIAGNVARILSIALVACFFGQEVALKLYHEFSGLIIFVVVVLLTISVGSLLQRTEAKPVDGEG